MVSVRFLCTYTTGATVAASKTRYEQDMNYENAHKQPPILSYNVPINYICQVQCCLCARMPEPK